MVYSMVVSTLEDMMQMLHTKKQDELLGGDEKRKISVAYTEMEKVKAYVQVYLVEKESEA